MASPAALSSTPERARIPPVARGLAIGLLALGGLALIAIPPGPWAATALNTLNTLAFLLGGLFSFLRAKRYPSSQKGWYLMALGLTLVGLGSAHAVLTWLFQRRLPPFPGLGDFAALLSVVAISVGLAFWPLTSGDGSERLRRTMDALGTGCAVLFLSWSLALEAFFAQSNVAPAVKVVCLLFMLGNATVLGFVGFLASGNTARLKGTLGWVGLTFLISVTQVLLQVPLGLENTYYLGHPVDLIVLASACTMLLGTASSSDPAQHQAKRWAEARDRRWLGMMLPVLPMLLCALVGTWLLIFHPARMDRPLLILGAFMMMLLAGRELLALRDFQSLSQTLEVRVEERTQALEMAQAIQLRSLRVNTIASLGAGLAHDLNNLLGVITSLAELSGMALERGEPVPPQDLARIKEASTRAGALTAQLMAFGRKQDQSQTAFDLADRVQAGEGILRMLTKAPVTLRLEAAGGLLPIRMDASHLDQILVNLVSNASHAMPKGGLICISTRREAPEGWALLEVQDQGSGMSPEVQAHLFEPFFSTKEAGRGTGLGLSSVKVMVDQAAGTLEVISALGQGTTIRVRFPLNQ